MHMLPVTYMIYCMQEKFEDIKGVIRGHKSKNDRQYNGQKTGQTIQWTKDRRTDNTMAIRTRTKNLLSITQKTKD